MLINKTLAAAVAAQLEAAGFCNGRVTANRAEPVDSGRLPSANVFVDPGSARPSGDPRTGVPKYDHTSKLVVEVIESADDGDQVIGRLCDHYDLVLETLLTDLAWGSQPGAEIEGIGGIDTLQKMEPRGDRELAQLQISFDVLHASVWPPKPAASDATLTRIDVRGPGGLGGNISVPQE